MQSQASCETQAANASSAHATTSSKQHTIRRPEQFVAVLDFGAQYGQLIARRVRDLHVYSELVPCDISADELKAMHPSALILSGGPASVYAPDAPSLLSLIHI